MRDEGGGMISEEGRMRDELHKHCHFSNRCGSAVHHFRDIRKMVPLLPACLRMNPPTKNTSALVWECSAMNVVLE